MDLSQFFGKTFKANLLHPTPGGFVMENRSRMEWHFAASLGGHGGSRQAVGGGRSGAVEI
jgi:hypothetical protein